MVHDWQAQAESITTHGAVLIQTAAVVFKIESGSISPGKSHFMAKLAAVELHRFVLEEQAEYLVLLGWISRP